MDSTRDADSSPTLSAPLLHSTPPKAKKLLMIFALSVTLLLLAATLLFIHYSVSGSLGANNAQTPFPSTTSNDETPFPWTNEMYSWQRTGYHFQPEHHFQADPNAALYYKGWYHFFYQYNPNSSIWTYDISWGHAVSKDLIHWLHLPIAMVPDHWYDHKGVWSGYSTALPDGRLIVLYTGGTDRLIQVQNLAVPEDPNDPLLVKWKKSNANPVLVPPPGIYERDFRDPFPVWYNESDSTWHMLIGSKDENHFGTVLIYTTKDFQTYNLLPWLLHKTAKNTGMLECVDLYPVATTGNQIGEGLEMQVKPGPAKKYVLKASMDDERHDYYALGTFDLNSFTFVPDDATIDVGVGLRYDYGKFYASKTFFDHEKKRRVLWGYVGEVDSKDDDSHKGWANLQNIPRTILFDTKTQKNLLIWPVEELNALRTTVKKFDGITVEPGTVKELSVGSATQLDIEVEFEINQEAVDAVIESDVNYNCSESGGAANRGLLGPFGMLVLANREAGEQTATYFYVVRKTDGDLGTFFCQDELHSSKANQITKRVVGASIPVLKGETYSLRMLVDHSIVESFAQKGRAVATSRVYPTEAIYDKTKVYVFNNATSAMLKVKSLNVWQMNSTFNHRFPGY